MAEQAWWSQGCPQHFLAPFLPRTLQEELEAAGLSRYALEKKCGVSRERIGCIESGDSIPTLHPGVRLVHRMGMTLATFGGKREDGA